MQLEDKIAKPFPKSTRILNGVVPVLLLMGRLAAIGAAQSTPQPLAIPPEFDRSVDMIVRPVGGQPFHPVFHSAEFAAKLVANGTPSNRHSQPTNRPIKPSPKSR